MRFNFNKFSNREQILAISFIILTFILVLISVISWLNNKNQSLEKENQNIISRLNYIESIPSSISSNRNLFSDSISILVNSTSKEKNIQIDRTQPLNDNSIMVWVNEVNFIDLYDWMILMGEQGGEIEKMNIRKSKQNKVNAQISALNAVSVVSDAVSNSENIVLVSISYERTRFIIEVQTNSYDQLQEYVDLVNSMGLSVNLGASRRVNNFIQGEISINAF